MSEKKSSRVGHGQGQEPQGLNDAHELENLAHVARDLRRKSFSGSVQSLDWSNDPRLDPSSPEFDHYLWAHTALKSFSRMGRSFPEQDIIFSNLSVSGSGASLQYQETVVSSLISPFRKVVSSLGGSKKTSRRRILRNFDGTLRSGELLLVLGRPGSGCSTFLKTLCGHLGGLRLETESTIHYRGIGFEQMIKQYRGDIVYNQEVDQHFPHLTVGETLSFAASARVPQQRPQGMPRDEYVGAVVKVVMALFGLSHTYNTKVGDNFVRGISGGERKRVSIAEMFLSRARFGAWDNSTRGLDAASALQFTKALRLSANVGKACHAVAAYQSSQSMFELFDKVVVLYEGREIYYGPAAEAVEYFEEMGWQRPPQQVAPDFLTAITNPGERQPKQGMENKVPRTPTEFAEHWKRSQTCKKLEEEIATYKTQHPFDGEDSKKFLESHKEQQSKHTRPTSPYLLSVPMQLRLCLRRAFQRMRNDVPATASTIIVQIVLSLVLGSIFYNTPNSSTAFFQKGAVMFFSVLLNAMITITEIILLYGQRPIVEKQARYAFVHPFTEALASVILDLPIKILRSFVFGIVIYFMTNLRRKPAQFFTFILFLTTAILTMSAIFRTLAAVTKSSGQAMALAGILVLCIVVYTGFTLPPPYMRPWLAWIRWINPIFYAFEGLVSNEFHGYDFTCASFVPTYGTGDSRICSAVGAIAGQTFISGDAFIAQNYEYYHSHLWRNYGILAAYMVVFHILYLTAIEYNTRSISKAEALVFRPGHAPARLQHEDGESQDSLKDVKVSSGVVPMNLVKQKDVLMWRGVNFDIPVKNGTRRLLNDVNGWVKPGTLTALMGVSGAGKTTLLDVLAQRTSIGVVTGDILVNGKGLSPNFPRRTGYVQQQDMHLETTTVREALRFSAILRQSRSVSKKEKFQYVEEVIGMLGMEDFAEAVVGSLGEGLNVEQRKLLSIGVELVAKPTLLIFLDEPTSGLDSQSSWTIVSFLRKLADNGQAVLATIHQPSALIFQTFDRLLFLASGGKTVYFGNIGSQSGILLDYFTRNGARPCESLENPAEYILSMVSGDGAPGVDWVEKWNSSPEREEIITELERLGHLSELPENNEIDAEDSHEFAVPFHRQLQSVVIRVFQQYFRQPEYIYSKFILGIASGLFIGFSFWNADNSMQGFQNSMFSIFLLCSIFSILVNQIMPKFVLQRSLYEVRERPSRVYSWRAFIISQILVEVPWQILLGITAWASFFYSVYGTSVPSESQALVLLFIVQFYVYAASMAQMVIAGVEDPALGAMLATLMFGMAFVFNGIMQPPDALPGFWIFMYHLSPFTYYVAGISSAALHGRQVECSDSELSVLNPPSGQTCGEYLNAYADLAGGRIYNPNATSGCEYCSMSSADQYLAARRIQYDDRWRNYGIFICYFIFNTVFCVILYYLFRVRRWKLRNSKKQK